MDRDLEALQQFLLQLAVEDGANLPCSPSNFGSEALLPPEGLWGQGSVEASVHDRSEGNAPQKPYHLNLGDIPAVQDRFYRLLKDRLASEAQRNLPLFPWETEVHDYETDSAAPALTPNRVGASSGFWMTQLRQFGLPVALPEALLSQLFQRCQSVAQTSLLEGAKLVQAVESLFPGDAYSLNNLAGLVMTSPARSGAGPVVDYPASYEAAAPSQQMVLSLLAAREILGALTLVVSPNQPQVERQWLTELGGLTLAVRYDAGASPAHLYLQGALPCAGSLTLDLAGQRTTAKVLTAGELSMDVAIQPQQPCTLEVCLSGDADAVPLVFTLRVEAA
jgi:hypothetical protein